MSTKNSNNPMSQKQPKLSASPERNTFQRDAYIKRKLEEGVSLDDPDVQSMIDWYNSWTEQSELQEADPEWQKDNLEYDLRSTDWVVEKVRASDSYAQNLYAAMCNNEFQRVAVMPILKNQRWMCSWRHAGGIVADLRGTGDYIDWYCSGINNDGYQDAPGAIFPKGFVSESAITDEIKEDLQRLGWAVVTDPDSAY
jgi:hypothetical protein